MGDHGESVVVLAGASSRDIPFLPLVGILAGVIGLVVVESYLIFNDYPPGRQFKLDWWLWSGAALGGLVFGVLVWGGQVIGRRA